MQALYLNPNHVTRPVQVPHFNQVAQIDPKTDALTGYAVIADKKVLSTSSALIVNTGIDCSDPTHVAKPVTPPMAIASPKPIYNHCGQLIGYIGSVVKNVAAPVATHVLML
tara:strand:+ start:110 stop:442 length:333 start_codon:yes stop_codon:yes gene_type:complete